MRLNKHMKLHMNKNALTANWIAAALLLSACATPPAAPVNNSNAVSPSATTAPIATNTPDASPIESTATVVVIDPNRTPIPSPAAPAAPAKPTETREIVIQSAQVEGLSVQVLESQPVQVKATVNGTLGDGCTSLNAIEQARTDNTFTITVTVKRPKDAMCTMIAKLYEESISLDVVGLKAGTYIVSAGTLSQTFTLAVDN